MFHEGQQIGLYTLINKLGKGGFGEVWLAERKSKFVTTKVAVKLPLDEQVDHKAIEQEAQLWEQASGHPNILPIIDADIIGEQVVIVSEYAEGGSLADKLKRDGKLPIKQAVEMTIGILNGLEFLHRKRIIHRDIKPANILLQDETPRLADFGISRAMQTTGISSTIIGTDAYMSPESFRGLRTVETDIWSVGVVLYQLLNGCLPFPQENPSERMYSIIQEEFAPLSSDIPSDLRRIIEKALAKLADNRYKTAGEMREELQSFLLKSSALPQLNSMNLTFANNLSEVLTITSQKPDIQKSLSETGAIFTQQISEVIPTPYHKKKSNFDYKEIGVIKPKYQREVTDIKYERIHRFKRGLARVKLNNKWGFIDGSGKEVIPLIYQYVHEIAEGLIAVKLNDKYGFIDTNGQEIIPQVFIDTYNFSEEVVAVKLNTKWGFINKLGEEIIPFKYDTVLNFNGGLAGVELDDKWGFVDKTGREVIPLQYEMVSDFVQGKAKARLNHVWNYIGKNGKIISKLKSGL